MAWFSLRGIEKLTYLIGIPSAAMYGGWRIYQKEVIELEQREKRIKSIEDKYLDKN
jgi:hypothetical protein